MATHPNNVIVTARGGSAGPVIPEVLVHHQEYPEIQGEGETPRQAAENLLNHLIASRDNVANGWHRGDLQQVIADVQAFIDQSPQSVKNPSSLPQSLA